MEELVHPCQCLTLSIIDNLGEYYYFSRNQWLHEVEERAHSVDDNQGGSRESLW